MFGGAMLATGALSGVLAGLLGIGGGIVIVPVLTSVLAALGVDEAIRVHIAVGTSLATIVPTSLSSARAHHLRGAVDLDLARRWSLPVLGGACAGVWLAARVHSDVLALVFAVVALLMAVKLLLPFDEARIAVGVPDGPVMLPVPVSIGAISTMMGVGGGMFSVAVLTLFNQPIHRAVGTAALFGLAISLPGALGFAWAGWGDSRLPVASLGYVNVAGFALIAPMTVLMAPLGAALAHRLPARKLSILFGSFLLLMSLRMGWDWVTG